MTTDPDPDPYQDVPGAGSDLAVEWSAFLPEGTEVGPSAARLSEPQVADGSALPAQGAAFEESWSPDPAELDQLQSDLDGVDAALLALDEGTYGTCQDCGSPIGDPLLASRPIRTTCGDHAPVDSRST